MPSKRSFLGKALLLGALALPLAAWAQTAPEGPDGFLPPYPDPVEARQRAQGPGFVDVTLKLAFVLGLIFLAAAAWRRYGRPLGPQGEHEAIRVWATRGLGLGSELYLVEVGDRMLLVGRSGAAVTTLSEFDDPAVIAEMKSNCVGPLIQPVGAGLLDRMVRRRTGR